jgi:hypothetical protein
MSIITLLTDFSDLYPASMKAMILSIAPQATIVDITHHIPPQNIKWGAAALAFTAPYFPDNTVHIAVVDPGVGSERRGIVVKASGLKTQYFVGPDNGLLIPAAETLGKFEVFEIRPEYFENVSKTFHGRDVFAPVGAEISLGRDLHKIGEPITDFIKLPAKTPVVDQSMLTGEILFIDSFGNIITNIPAGLALQFMKPGDTVCLKGQRLRFAQAYADVSIGEPLLLMGSHGFLEISVNRGSAEDYFNLEREHEVQITK